MQSIPIHFKIGDVVDLTVTERIFKELNGFEIARFPKSKAARWKFDAYDIAKEKKYKSLVKDATLAAKALTYATIPLFAYQFGKNFEYLNELPEVFILTNTEANLMDRIISLDYGDFPITYLPGTCFMPKRLPFSGLPDGPQIWYESYNFDLGSVLEESFHFLQHIYTTDKIERSLRQPLENEGCYGPKNESGRIVEEKVSGNLFRAYFQPDEGNETIYRNIYYEAGAYLACSLNGYTIPPRALKNGDSDIEQLYPTLFDVLISEGISKSFARLFEAEKVSSFHEMLENHPLTTLVGSFPRSLIHFIGYNLGRHATENCYTDEQVRTLGSIMLNSNSSAEKNIDDLVYFCKANKLAGNIGDYLKVKSELKK